MANDTRQRILGKALEMFSECGYNGTNLRDLAASLELSKSALYRHFTSKEAIWDAVIAEIDAYYTQRFGSVDHLPPVPRNTDELAEMTMNMIRFTIRDERIIRVRRILMTEQFRSDRMRQLASFHFLYSTEAIFTRIFAAMMENGSLKKDDPAMLAFAYTAPVTALIHLSDREPEKEREALEKAQCFIRHFIDVYGSAGQQPGVS